MRMPLLFAALLAASPALAGTLTLAPTTVTEWKAVYGRVEARDTVPARARIGAASAWQARNCAGIEQGDTARFLQC